jgi:hypothetical protein
MASRCPLRGMENLERRIPERTVMNDARDWKEEYASLNRFIADNPGIVINTSEISISQSLREEFYVRFDKIRAALVETHYSALPVDIESLCRNFLQIEKEVLSLLGIDKISMPVDLFSFLHTPKEGLTRIIYNRLFDLLQGKTTAEVFETQCVEDLKYSSADLFRLGYEWWAGLALIKLLEPDEAFFVDLDPDYKPFLAELKEISFGRQAHHPTMRIPEFVLHSRKFDRYVAVKMAVTKEVENYVEPFKPPVRPKKRTGDTSLALDSRVMILSFMSSREDIPVLTDVYDNTLTSPDWMAECVTRSELRDPAVLEGVRLHMDILKPRSGMLLIVMDQNSEEILEQIPENIYPVLVGFDQSRLESVIASLA